MSRASNYFKIETADFVSDAQLRRKTLKFLKKMCAELSSPESCRHFSKHFSKHWRQNLKQKQKCALVLHLILHRLTVV